MKKRMFALCLAMAMALSLVACGGEKDGSYATGEPGVPADSVPDAGTPAAMGEDGSWAVYWYLCGSNLETNYGCASIDLSEM